MSSKVAKGKRRISIIIFDFEFEDLAVYAGAKGYGGHNDYQRVQSFIKQSAFEKEAKNQPTAAQIERFLRTNPTYAGKFVAVALKLQKEGNSTIGISKTKSEVSG